MHSSKAWLSLAALAVVVHAHAADHSKWQRDCAEWIQKKGYSVSAPWPSTA
ncbi:MAG TPA: hypothetical protein VMT14_18050 [Burkholderiaceae bacterium]|nr:hypothetical protein [Burkholderiaceae bacterium]